MHCRFYELRGNETTGEDGLCMECWYDLHDPLFDPLGTSIFNEEPDADS